MALGTAETNATTDATNSGIRTTSARSQSSHAVASYAVVLVFSVVTNVVAARTLDPSARGSLALGIQVAAFLSAFLLLGVEKAMPVVFNESPMPRTIPFLWAATYRQAGALLAIGVVAAIGWLLVGAELLGTSLVFVLPVTMLAVATMLDGGFKAAALNASRSQLVLVSGGSVSALILLGAVSLSAAGLRAVPLWLLMYATARLVVSLPLHARFGSRGSVRGATDPDALQQMRQTGRRLWLASFSNFAALRSDRLLLPVLGSTAELGIYVVASTLTDVMATPTEAIANVLLPRWRTDVLRGRLETRLVLLGIAVYLVAGFCALLLIGPWVTELLFGATYRPTATLVGTLAAASAVFGMNRILSARAMALGATKSVSLSETLGVVVALVAYLALIPTHGTLGAAMGSLSGYCVTAAGLVIVNVRSSQRSDLRSDVHSAGSA